MQVPRRFFVVSAMALSLHCAMAPMPISAQQPAASTMSSTCHGSVNIVRLSEINPGKMETFLSAVAAQQAWYKNAGTADEISVMRVLEQNPTTKEWTLSETQAITTHIIPAAPRKLAHDAAWDAFVALFKDSSTIKSELPGCIAAK